MESLTNLLNTASNTVGSLLQDPATEESEQTSDRVVATTSALSADFGQHATRPSTGLHPITGPTQPTNSGTDMDLFIKMFSRNVFLESFDFGTGQSQWNVMARCPATQKLFSQGRPLAALGKLWKHFRGDLKITVQCNAPTGAVGAFVIFWVPHHIKDENTRWSQATIFNLPHLVFNVGNMNVGTLVVPYTYHKTYMTATTSDSFGLVYAQVLARYTVPEGTPTGIKVSLFGALENLTFTNPTTTQAPDPPAGRSHYTNFKYTVNRSIITESNGCANMANVMYTGSNVSLAAAGERIMYARDCSGQTRPVRDLMEIARIPSLWMKERFQLNDRATFDWSNSQNAGTNVLEQNVKFRDMGNIGILHNYFCGWSGTIELELTVFASVMHKGKLAIIINQADDTTPDLNTMNRLQYTLLDVGLNSSVRVPIPYMFDSWMRPTGNEEHLKLTIKVISELTYNAAAASTVKCMVRFRAGQDFKFYFPKPTSLATQISWGSEMDLRDPFSTDDTVQEALSSNHTMNEQQAAAATGLADAGNAGGLDDIITEPTPLCVGVRINRTQIAPISYTDVFTFFGRSWLVGEQVYAESSSNIKLNVKAPKVGHASLMSFFTFFAGEVNFTICNDSDNTLIVSHAYVDFQDDSTGAGAIAIPARTISTFTAPFYSTEPLRGLEDERLFGTLHLNCGYLRGSFKVYASLRCPNFFVPRPFPMLATGQTLMEDPASYVISKVTKEACIWHLLNKDPLQALEIKEETVNPMLASFMQELRRTGYRGELLMQAGDIESNPGPVELVYRHRGLYKHYGVSDGERVYHLNTDDILWSAITGKATTRCDPIDGSWIKTGRSADAFGYEIPVQMEFTIDSNCETFAKQFVPGGTTQGQALKMWAATIFTFSLATCVENQDFTTLFSKLSSVIMDTMHATVTSKLLRFMLRMLLYAIMFCHSPNLMTGGAMAGLMFMDYQDLVRERSPGWVKGLVKAMIDGDVQTVCTNLIEGMQDETSPEEMADTIKETAKLTSQAPESPFDGFNKFSLAAKNFDWWLDLMKKIVDKVVEFFKPSTARKFAAIVEQYRHQLALLFTSVAQAAQEAKRPGSTSSIVFSERVDFLRTQVNHWHQGFVEFCPRHELAQTMAAAVRTMTSIDLAPSKPSEVSRVEPVGVLLRGAPGQGKSFFSMVLIKEICRLKSWDTADVFQHPVGSKHMDGYAQQNIHLIDDLGQNANDEDFELLCQMISTISFPVPMARLEEKATWYTSKLVIATTNRGDFNTKTINTAEALERRFGFNYTIKAKQQYTKDGKLDVVKFTPEIQEGITWTDDAGRPLNPFQIAREIVEELNRREQITKFWNNYMRPVVNTKYPGVYCYPIPHTDGPNVPPVKNQNPSLLDYETWESRLATVMAPVEEWLFHTDEEEILAPQPLQRFTRRVEDSIGKFGRWLAKHGHWISFGSALVGIIGIVTWWICNGKHAWKEPEKMEKDDQVYGGEVTVQPKKTLFKKNSSEPIRDQGPGDELTHITRGLVRLVADGVQVFGIAIGEDKLLTFGHSDQVLFKAGTVEIVYGSMRVVLENPEFTRLTVGNVETDLAIVKTNSTFRMTSMVKHFTRSLGTDPILVWNTKNGIYTQSVSNVQALGAATTAEGTWSHDCVSYNAHTGSGTCGGALCVKVGGMYKILGMHVAGNGFIGRAIILPTNQGTYYPINPLPIPPAHLVKKTRLQPSPLHGIVPVTKGPAVLDKKDPRTRGDPLDQVYLKNVGNYFQVRDVPRFEEAVMNVRSRLVSVIGVHPESTMEEALFDGANAIDMSTSPGHKYTTQGLRKGDLINKENRWVSPILKADVDELMEQARSGTPLVYFTTALKDELRSLDKIDEAKTRVIEASNFDYTVAFRMVFGKQVDIICATPAEDTGFAMGINPMVDWTSLIRSLYPHNQDFDYKAFDGSLSTGLMRAAGHVLAGCVEDENLFLNLLEASIISIHHGVREDYMLVGTNPSGTPFTTVLNCACNLIVVEYFMLSLANPMPYLAVTYGDDLVLSTPEVIDANEFSRMLKLEFGMTITPSDKESSEFVDKGPMDVEFLKRTAKFYTSDTIVGVLSLDNMLQHIMWCKGLDEFSTQMISFYLELAAHGEETYDRIRELFKTRKIVLPKFADAKFQLDRIVYQL
uniref:Genome polyprotein n=1 Tax=Miniopterus bat picornavirus TaxID=3141889 RepID=A0AAU7E2P1_9VIRU